MDLITDVVNKLQGNSKDVLNEAVRLLVKIADNILNDPTNFKIRSLQKSNATIAKKILHVKGGVECLKVMGFEEDKNGFTFPPGASLVHLDRIRTRLIKIQSKESREQKESNAFVGLLQSSSDDLIETTESETSSDEDESLEATASRGAIPKKSMDPKQVEAVASGGVQCSFMPRNVPLVQLPPLIHIFSNPFLREMETSFHAALAYADKDLHQRAKAVIPTAKLEINAQNRLRTLQEQIKKDVCEDPNISFQDMLLLELLAWFKNDFFTWVDSPDCVYCGGETKFSHMSTDQALLVHTSRVEMHKCQTCQNFTPFPRYNDVNLLLISRSGRCGEWANTFTLLCCAMGWDARYVIDLTDHVWTEVYSFAQKRWLHCDPCENACDTPLVYESGWGKKLSYVIAYSSEEVQDVTWRYSSHHKEILSRRTRCSESELIDALIKLREQRQKNFNTPRREYLTKRLLAELTELMVERKPNETDKQGRSSGSLAWRLVRGETQPVISSCYCWNLDVNQLSSPITIRYSAALDQYESLSNGKQLMALKEWHTGVFHASDVFRKEEQDWKMVYLTRQEGTIEGKLSWKFSVSNSNKAIDVVDILFNYQLYETGKVSVEIQGDNSAVQLPRNAAQLRTSAFSGSRSVTITASLSGGNGDVAWQHAQLFRQQTSSTDYPFSVTFTFRNRSS